MNERFVRRAAELTPRSDLVWFIALNIGLGFTLIAAYLKSGRAADAKRLVAAHAERRPAVPVAGLA